MLSAEIHVQYVEHRFFFFQIACLIAHPHAICIIILQCVKDKAVETESAKAAMLQCSNPDCPWEGKKKVLICNSYEFTAHMKHTLY